MADNNNRTTPPHNVGIPQLRTCLHPCLSAPIGYAPQINNQPSIINRQIPCSPAPLQPDSMILQSQFLSEFVPIRVASWLVSSLRSKPPNLPIPPILPQPYFLCVLGDLCGVRAIMQNKPNFLMPKINATSCAANIYTNIPLRAAPGKQTQSNPTCRGEAFGEAGTDSTPPPPRSTLPASRFTPAPWGRYDIRYTNLDFAFNSARKE